MVSLYRCFALMTIPPNKILAIETSSEMCSVAASAGDHVVSRHVVAGQTHSQIILPLIDELMVELGISINDIELIGFGAGPGSFTGLRIGCGVAQGLGFSIGCRLIPVNSMIAMAQMTGKTKVVVCIDARMKQVYNGAYVYEGNRWTEVIAANVSNPDEVPPLPGNGWAGCGTGFQAYGEVLKDRYGEVVSLVSQDLFVPNALSVLKLTVSGFEDGLAVEPENALPLYVRDKVALTLEEQGR
jgi:tRNA threonylcarbamoyladenosine biosynthesis protein TsaB